MSEFDLTQKANFVESDEQALANTVFAVGILYTMLDNMIRVVNKDNPLSLNLWEIGEGLQSAAEMYIAQQSKGVNNA